MSAIGPALDQYQLRLPSFAGPLDVLLRLIERHELAITTISLATVADQFLAHLAALPDRDPAVLAEFAAIASRLLVLKTRVLFPRPPVPAAGDEEVDDSADLVRQLREYQQFKAAALTLAAREATGLRAFEPLAAPDRTGFTADVTLAPARPADLVRAVQRRLARLPAASQLLRLPPRISVGEMAARIVERLRGDRRGALRFSALLPPDIARTDTITTFLALLELVRRRQAAARQETLFGEIVVLALPAEHAVEPTSHAADD